MPRNKILTYTITATDTWELFTGTNLRGVKRWFIKTRNSTDNSFDMAFVASPGNDYISSDGSAIHFDGCELEAVYVKTATSGTVFEIHYYS